MTIERRKHRRRALNCAAWIKSDQRTLHDCNIVDISEGGAKIRLASVDQLPDIFDLLFTKQGTPRRSCRVVWRESVQLGVEFESGADNYGQREIVET